ncbi:hypothetical protein J6590_063046 [Homalodisca vitripennis]|nr:hypothetical protein J6590_063046 [Homalodisca vitripennis]
MALTTYGLPPRSTLLHQRPAPEATYVQVVPDISGRLIQQSRPIFTSISIFNWRLQTLNNRLSMKLEPGVKRRIKRRLPAVRFSPVHRGFLRRALRPRCRHHSMLLSVSDYGFRVRIPRTYRGFRIPARNSGTITICQ